MLNLPANFETYAKLANPLYEDEEIKMTMAAVSWGFTALLFLRNF